MPEGCHIDFILALSDPFVFNHNMQHYEKQEAAIQLCSMDNVRKKKDFLSFTQYLQLFIYYLH